MRLEDRATVCRLVLADAPSFTGPVLDPMGRLAIYLNGEGLRVGPLQPEELRAFARQALAIAQQLETEDAAAAADARAALDRIVREGADG